MEIDKINEILGKRFGRLTVLEYSHSEGKNGMHVVYRCICDCGNKKNIRRSALICNRTKSCGCLKKKIVYGFGINDYNDLVKIGEKHIESYKNWRSMIERCYSDRWLAKYPTYIGCSVCEEWRYFTNFKKWFDENYIDGYALDKDLLVQGNKIYSPETCCFVPQYINNIFLNRAKDRGIYPIGVSLEKRNGKLFSSCRIDGQNKFLGYFENEDEAHEAYKKERYAEIKKEN